MRRTSVRSSGASATTAWCERIPQGARNSGRVVATTSSGACAPRSASAWMRSSDVGSAQCRSSKASTTGWVLAPARSRATIAASCRLRSSSGPNFGARSAGSGISSSGARSVAVSWTSSFTWASVVSRSASRLSAATSWPPKRARPHSATGCRGVFCRSWDEFHSTQVCGVSPSREWNSSTSRDFPSPGSPTIWTNWPSPARTRSQRRSSVPMSSSRPTNGVNARTPPLRPPPLARTTR